MGDRMTTIDDLARVERELRESFPPTEQMAGYGRRAIYGWADTIAAYIAAQGWRSIETAPRDGTAVLLASSAGAWFGTWKPVYQSGYMPLNPWFSLMLNHDHLHRPSGLPTHWMPLPEPPKENTNG